MAGNGGPPHVSPVVAQLTVRRHANGMYSLDAPTDIDHAYLLVARAQEMLYARIYESKKPASPILVPQIVPPRL